MGDDLKLNWKIVDGIMTAEIDGAKCSVKTSGDQWLCFWEAREGGFGHSYNQTKEGAMLAAELEIKKHLKRKAEQLKQIWGDE